MNDSNNGNLVLWKVLILSAAIISLGYGVILVVNLHLNPPQELRELEKESLIKDMTFDCGLSQIEGKISSKDFLANTPIHVTLTINTSNTETTKIISILIPYNIDKIPADSISKIESFYNNQTITLEKISNSTIFKGQGELIINRPDNYQILLLEFDTNEKMNCYSFSHNQFSVVTNNELLQIKSAKAVIRNGIIMEALSWIIVGATGIMFLAQVGLKDE